MYTIERHESYRGRTTPEIEWRVWNPTHTQFTAFRTKREAVHFMDFSNVEEDDEFVLMERQWKGK
jgi:hypothetical protein